MSFAGILKYDTFPLAPILTDLLDAGTAAMGGPIELEFAVDLNPDDQGRTTFSFLQIRPVVPAFSGGTASLDDIDPSTCLLSSSQALGEGSVPGIHDLIFVRPGAFDRSRTREMVAELQRINDSMTAEDRYYGLVVPGRLCSSPSPSVAR